MRGEERSRNPVAMTIAGFDPSSGAGITADLAVFAAHGLFGIAAITALTVQSTTGVRRSEPVAPDLLAETLACLQDDLPPDGIKIGMLSGEEQVRTVVDYLLPLRASATGPAVVLDPVLRSSTGAPLLSEPGISLLRRDLLPLVDVITPNASELAVLTGKPCATPMEVLLAARSLTAKYPKLTVIVTGGDGPEPNDLLVQGEVATALAGERIDTQSTHGTGCAFSSALLCGLLYEDDMLRNAWDAKLYVEAALTSAVPRGRGRGPMNLACTVSRRREL